VKVSCQFGFQGDWFVASQRLQKNIHDVHDVWNEIGMCCAAEKAISQPDKARHAKDKGPPQEKPGNRKKHK